MYENTTLYNIQALLRSDLLNHHIKAAKAVRLAKKQFHQT